MSNLLILKISGIAATSVFLVYQVRLYQKYLGWKVPARHKIFSILLAAAMFGIFVAAISCIN